MRPGNSVSPHMKDQFIWNKLSPRSSSRVKREPLASVIGNSPW
jgi:hypothetical protein